jgi:hypothetical protein
MHSVFDRLKTALADRYAIQEELGAGDTLAKMVEPDAAYTSLTPRAGGFCPCPSAPS